MGWRRGGAAVALALAAVVFSAGAGEQDDSPARRIAGQWRIALEGLPIDHQEILASLAVDGELLIGTLTVGRETVNVSAGKVIGTAFSFSFQHRSGETFRMRGIAGPDGLAGTWEARNEKGKWRARRVAS